MSLKKGEGYTKTLLKRAKGSLLEVSIDQDVPVPTMTLLSPHTQQIRCLVFGRNHWEGIRKFSEANLGPLPLLCTLRVSSIGADEDDQPTITPPSYPFFAEATNVEEFVFNSRTFQFLNHFIFPALTTFRLRMQEVARSKASDFFDFLKASPMLQTVSIHISVGIMLEDVPQEMVVTLPNVETFSLTSDGKNTYDVTVHLSCPHARDVSLTSEVIELDISPSWEIFPAPVPWNTIIHHYMGSPVEEVTLEIQAFYEPCSLTFWSSDTSTIKLVFQLFLLSDDEDSELDIGFNEIFCEAFSQGLGTIRNHPLLRNVKRLHIRCRDFGCTGFQTWLLVTEIESIFEGLGPLETLTICGCNLYLYLAGFSELGNMKEPIVFPHIRHLTISHPSMEGSKDEYMDAIVDLTKSQHARGMPFERVTVRAESLPAVMEERLRQWVSVMDCCEEDPPVED